MVAPADCANCTVLRAFGPNSCVAVPLRAGQQALGALCVVRTSQQAYHVDHARSLRMLANAAAIAITNARLTEAAHLEAARTAACGERERLAAELHDSLAQTLAFLNFKASALESQLEESAGSVEAAVRVGSFLAAMAAAIATAYAQVREALTGLQRPAAHPNDLGDALTRIIAEFRTATGVVAELLITDRRCLAISAQAQVQIQQIIREALTNIRRHAEANRVEVRVACSDGEAHFVVADDGCGFDPHNVDTPAHLGLAIMRRRAASCGGRLVVESAPGAGTRIIALFPLEQRGELER
jgi:two-component system nitrate/nitrite sensor histidine kinase NarX